MSNGTKTLYPDIARITAQYTQPLLPKTEGFLAPKTRLTGFLPPKLTEAQQELLPFVQEEAKKEARRRGLLQPVEALFDVLSRGQYLTAGVAQKVIRNMQSGVPLLRGMPDVVKDAVTGKVKYDWGVVLFGGEHKGGEVYEGLFPWEPTTGGGKFAKGAATFLANVALDPFTYLGFGASTAARGAATAYADDVVKFAIRGIGKNAKEVLPDIIQKGFSKQVFAEKVGKNLPDAIQYLQKYAGGDVTKFYSQLRKKAFREALRKPGKELTEKLLKEYRGELGEVALKAKEKMTPELVERAKELKKTLTYLKTEPYAGAGQRAARYGLPFMKREFAVGERYPQWLQTMDKVMTRMRESKIGGLFSDAWWALANNPKSPVANIRRMFHIRNPYQKMVSIFEKDIMADTSYSMVLKGEHIKNIFSDLTDSEKNTVKEAMIASQVMQERAKKAPQYVPIRAKQIAQKYGKDVDVNKVMRVIDEVNNMTDEWWKFNKEAYEKGLSRDIGHWMDYLPEQPLTAKGYRKSGTRLYTARPGYTSKRKAGWSGNIQDQVSKLKWMYDIDEDTAIDVLMHGGGDLNVDIENMLMRRALAQTMFEQRIKMIEQFREFGIKLDDIKNMPEGEGIYRSLVGKWGQLEQLGLKPIHTKGLEGYLFDREIADILERAVDVGKSDKTLKAFVDTISNFTSWWRGWATLSPGFHMRNFYSNNMTGFLKHGMEWFDMKTHLESFVGTAIGLHGVDEGVRQLSKILPEEVIRKTMNTYIGLHTLSEHALWGGSKGLITRMVKGYGQPTTFSEISKTGANISPFSRQFVGMRASRGLGSYIESQARFQSYLLDVKRAMKQGATMDTAMEYAKREAKFWFIDYTDLSKFEQQWGKNIVPFYTWLRGALGVQLTGMLRYPEMYAMLPKATEALTAKGGPAREELPEWMRELGMFPISVGEEGTKMFWPNFPYQELSKIPLKFEMEPTTGIPLPVPQDFREVIADIAADAHPVIKTLIEVIPKEGVDVFYRTPLGDTQKAPRALRVLTKSKPVLTFLDGLMRGVGFEEGLRIDVNDKGQLVMDSAMAKILENNILPLRMIPQYLDLPELLIPAIEDWKRKVTGAVDDYEAMEEFLQTLSFYAGIKMKELELEEEQFRRREEIIEKAQKARSRLLKKLPGSEARSQEWRQQREEYQRRLGL